jgi:hypothetical protein
MEKMCICVGGFWLYQNLPTRKILVFSFFIFLVSYHYILHAKKYSHQTSKKGGKCFGYNNDRDVHNICAVATATVPSAVS